MVGLLGVGDGVDVDRHLTTDDDGAAMVALDDRAGLSLKRGFRQQVVHFQRFGGCRSVGDKLLMMRKSYESVYRVISHCFCSESYSVLVILILIVINLHFSNLTLYNKSALNFGSAPRDGTI